MDIFQTIKGVDVADIDNYINNNQELQELMLRSTEAIRLKNLKYFEVKKNVQETKRELELAIAEKTRDLTEAENKNAETRKAAITLNPSVQNLTKGLDDLELELEEVEQELWVLRHLESSLRMISELRIVEMKKIV